MQATEKMIQAAVQKAKEHGVLPRKGQVEDIATNNEIIAEILQAAFNSSSTDYNTALREKRDEE